MMNGMMDGNGMGGGCFWLISIIIVVAIIMIVVWMIKPRADQSSSQADSLETLKRRLANGEITEEEYDRLKKKLEQ